MGGNCRLADVRQTQRIFRILKAVLGYRRFRVELMLLLLNEG